MKNLIAICCLLSVSTVSYGQSTATKLSAEDLVNEQLAGYNARNVEQFLRPYSDSISLYAFPRQRISQGKETMRKRYHEFFAKYPALHGEVVNRMVLDNTVIDHERVTLDEEMPPLRAIAIYTINDNRITEVTFVYPEGK